jgi:CIC family chloride channel protein
VLNNTPFGLGLLLALLVAKLILTPLSIGGGFQGGVFAPSLFIGAMLGAAYSTLGQRLLPGLNLEPASYAMVGMAAMLAGTVHAPLTAILLPFEMTNDYHIILPLMFAVVVSLSLARRLQRQSIYTLALARKGIHLQRGRDIEVLETITVGEVMQTSPPFLSEDETLEEASVKFMRLRLHGLPVVNHQGELAGMLTVQDLERAQSEGLAPHTPVGQVCTRQLVVAYPDETIGAALRRMSVRDIGRLPVVSRQNARHLAGLLRRTDLIRAYDVALVQRETLRQRGQQVRLGAVSGAEVHEVVVERGAACANHLISQTAWPRNAIIVTVRRGREVIVPHGNTLLQVGDVLTVIADDHALEALQRLCKG